jgi:2-keto-4-pentenoate hydratase/2-oxohepta-3-ene-1,7-dioic acid hydratase in catechol pathway
MRLANLDDRLILLGADGGAVDVHQASGGRFGPDPQAVYDEFDAFGAWAAEAAGDLVAAVGAPVAAQRLGAPVPRPRQVFAVALNYPEHAGEAEFTVPEHPLLFTKFPSCLVGPEAVVEVATDMVDYEAELVVVLGRRAHRVAAADAWAHVAGLTVGQDLSARDVQRWGPAPQFSLGKSFPGFGPTGPAVVTLDELDPGALEITCRLNGEVVQNAPVTEMVFSIPTLIEAVSAICPLLPGDLLFTGTPAGVGARRTPPRFLRDGDRLESEIPGIGSITQTFVAPAGGAPLTTTTTARTAHP